MRIQVVFLITLLLAAAPAYAACFDFSRKITKSLHEPIAMPATGDATEKGKTSEGVTWAQVRGRVNKPISKVLELLLDHNNTKSSRVDEMTVEKLSTPHFLAHHKVRFLIKPFLFIKVRWTEEWGYALESGTPAKPESLVISYEKIEGTHYIQHLCGSTILRKLSDDSTDVYQFEEAKAESRSANDTLKGLEGTLVMLRK